MNLRYQGICKCRKVVKKVNGTVGPVLDFIFNLVGIDFKIKAYIPHPRRCSYCQKFGLDIFLP